MLPCGLSYTCDNCSDNSVCLNFPIFGPFEALPAFVTQFSLQMLGSVAELQLGVVVTESLLQQEIAKFVQFISIIALSMGMLFFIIGCIVARCVACGRFSFSSGAVREKGERAFNTHLRNETLKTHIVVGNLRQKLNTIITISDNYYVIIITNM